MCRGCSLDLYTSLTIQAPPTLSSFTPQLHLNRANPPHQACQILKNGLLRQLLSDVKLIDHELLSQGIQAVINDR